MENNVKRVKIVVEFDEMNPNEALDYVYTALMNHDCKQDDAPCYVVYDMENKFNLDRALKEFEYNTGYNFFDLLSLDDEFIVLPDCNNIEGARELYDDCCYLWESLDMKAKEGLYSKYNLDSIGTAPKVYAFKEI